ncbi:MAG: HD domain-containing protein [Firmicutes bacterium]|nr:HD domain-containing protein [Bacillota bacterium]
MAAPAPTGAPRALSAAHLPTAVARLCRALEGEEGGAAYVVGGAVRDLLLGRPTRDHDVATPLVPERVAEVLRRHGFDVVPTGVRFGTLTAVPAEGGAPVEVTTLRAEGGYRDRRHPERVVWTTDVATDLGRRDFTVNALAWRPFVAGPGPGDGVLVDPYGGRRDLARRRLRAVGEPEARLREDPLRVARLFRLAAELGFRPEAATARAARHAAPDLAYVARERVRDELDRLLLAPRLADVMADVARVLLPHAIPLWRELTAFEESRWRGSLTAAALVDRRLRVDHKPVDLHSVLTAALCPPRPVLRWAALLHDLGKPRTFARTPSGRVAFHGHEAVGAEMAREAMRDLRQPTRLTERVAALVAVHLWPWEEASAAGLRRLVRQLGEEGARDLLDLHRADVAASTPLGWPAYEAARKALEEAVAQTAAPGGRRLAVDGRDVMRVLGIRPGPRVGEVLRALGEVVLERPEENTRERLLLRLAERRWR